MNTKKVCLILLSLYCLSSNLNGAMGVEVSDKRAIDRLEHLEKTLNTILEGNKYEGDYAKQIQIEANTRKFIEKLDKIENKEDKKKIHGYTIKKLKKEYTTNIEKHNFYLKGFVSTVGFGTEASYYYKNFIGFGFIFNYQEALFSEAINKVLNFYGSLTGNIDENLLGGAYYRVEDFPLNIKTMNFGAFVSIRPFKNPLHIDAGIMFSKLEANGYVVPTDIFLGYDNISKRLVIDNYSPRPYVNIGCDFEVYDFTFGFDIGAMMFAHRKLDDMFDELANFGIEKGIIKEDGLRSQNFWIGEDNIRYYYFDRENGTRGTAEIIVPQINKFNIYFKISVGYKFKI